jgi:thiamine pyrophosphokinase
MPPTSVATQPIILVAVGGAPEGAVRLPELPAGSVVVAADAGLAGLRARGVAVHHVVGDLDSVAPATVAAAEAAGAVVHRHHADKDATDLELALDLVVDELAGPGLERLLVVGPGGGRLDHLLADVALLSAPRLAALEVAAHLDGATVQVVRPGRHVALVAPRGAQVSLLPMHGPADGVTTHGLRWPLVDAHLAAGTTRAMSNEVTDPPATVQLSRGVLVAVEPGTPAPQIPPRATPYDPTPRPSPDARSEEEQP